MVIITKRVVAMKITDITMTSMGKRVKRGTSIITITTRVIMAITVRIMTKVITKSMEVTRRGISTSMKNTDTIMNMKMGTRVQSMGTKRVTRRVKRLMAIIIKLTRMNTIKSTSSTTITTRVAITRNMEITMDTTRVRKAIIRRAAITIPAIMKIITERKVISTRDIMTRIIRVTMESMGTMNIIRITRIMAKRKSTMEGRSMDIRVEVEVVDIIIKCSKNNKIYLFNLFFILSLINFRMKLKFKVCHVLF